MDPVSAMSGIVGLFSACRNCYAFFEQIKNAEKDMRLMMTFLDIEASSLQSWGHAWGIYPEDKSRLSKLEDDLKQNSKKEHGVATTLLGIAELLTNDRNLLKKYDVRLRLTDGQGKGKGPKNHRRPIKSMEKIPILKALDLNKAVMEDRIGLLKRCKWTIRGSKNRFSELLEALRHFNNSLYRLCPEMTRHDISLFRYMDFLDGHDESFMLYEASEQTSQLAQDEKDPVTKRELKQLVDMMRLKSKAGFYNTKPVTDNERCSLLNYQPQMFTVRQERERESSTLATLRVPSGALSMVYVEYKSYKDNEGKKSLGRRDDSLKLGRLMLNRESSDQLNIMTCLGLFEDGVNERIGFVFKLPSPLGSLLSWEVCEPRRLLNILSRNKVPFGLDWRLNLAKRLVHNVIRLHAVGWLHKNIRSDSILLFLKSPFQPVVSPEKSYCEPYLMGYDFIRIEADPSANYKLVSPQGTGMNTNTAAPHQINHGLDKRPDIYHHPAKRSNPDRSYQYAYDIYSLGLLLVEIGLWKSLYTIVAGRQFNPIQLQEYMLGVVNSEVVGACGPIYANVVRTFITMESAQNPDTMKNQRDTCAKMASELSRCVV
ncbi:prion-inhibition and propagation-domain-containing protein [Annulohypoxylon moriforme]|nr:prion-inhibition and propagation-domain-containing protein [Annulohypoxylon moriforme]